MLVISRKEEETIEIGDDIVIKIVSINGRQIRVGVEAPEHMKIHRGGYKSGKPQNEMVGSEK